MKLRFEIEFVNAHAILGDASFTLAADGRIEMKCWPPGVITEEEGRWIERDVCRVPGQPRLARGWIRPDLEWRR